jgi:hypothetical protein
VSALLEGIDLTEANKVMAEQSRTVDEPLAKRAGDRVDELENLTFQQRLRGTYRGAMADL